MGDRIKVLLVDDHALFREGVAEIFDAEEGMEVVGVAANGQEAVELTAELKPDVVLMDVEMPTMGAEPRPGALRTTVPGAIHGMSSSATSSSTRSPYAPITSCRYAAEMSAPATS